MRRVAGRYSPGRKLLTGMGVLGVHAALIALFLRAGSRPADAPHPDSQPLLVLLERPVSHPLQAPPAPSAARVHTPIRSHRPRPPAQSLTRLPMGPPSPNPSVDWYAEAELEGLRHAQSTPSGARAGASVTASPVCKTRPQAHWEPEPKRVGLAGGLIPYVRIGPCAIGLAMFGCAFGRQEANGHVLDVARDHDPDVLDGPDCAP